MASTPYAHGLAVRSSTASFQQPKASEAPSLGLTSNCIALAPRLSQRTNSLSLTTGCALPKAHPRAQKLMTPRASAGTAVAPKIEITKSSSIEALAAFAPWTLEGPNKQWTLWVCEPSDFPWVYDCDEYAHVLQGTFTVQYEGDEPVEINAGDFVHFSPGTTKFSVKAAVRKFYHLAQ